MEGSCQWIPMETAQFNCLINDVEKESGLTKMLDTTKINHLTVERFHDDEIGKKNYCQ